MPTLKQRYQITETEAVGAAIDSAARRWPGESRSRLLLRLVELGRQELEGEESRATEAHRAAVEANAGRFTGLYPERYLQSLREDWSA